MLREDRTSSSNVKLWDTCDQVRSVLLYAFFRFPNEMIVRSRFASVYARVEMTWVRGKWVLFWRETFAQPHHGKRVLVGKPAKPESARGRSLEPSGGGRVDEARRDWGSHMTSYVGGQGSPECSRAWRFWEVYRMPSRHAKTDEGAWRCVKVRGGAWGQMPPVSPYFNRFGVFAAWTLIRKKLVFGSTQIE